MIWWLDRSVVVGKLDKSRFDIEEAIDSASEGDKVVGKPELVSRRTETSWGDIHDTLHDGNGTLWIAMYAWIFCT